VYHSKNYWKNWSFNSNDWQPPYKVISYFLSAKSKRMNNDRPIIDRSQTSTHQHDLLLSGFFRCKNCVENYWLGRADVFFSKQMISKFFRLMFSFQKVCASIGWLSSRTMKRRSSSWSRNTWTIAFAFIKIESCIFVCKVFQDND